MKKKHQNASTQRLYITSFLFFAWMAVIFGLSDLPGHPPSTTPTVWYFLERKGAHVVEFALLMFLAVRFFRQLFPKETLQKIIAVSLMFLFMFAAADELHQFFVPYRGAKISDVAIDLLGGLITALLFLRLAGRRQAKKK